LAPKATTLGEMTQSNGDYIIPGHSVSSICQYQSKAHTWLPISE